jgi:mRNA interferase HigB
MHLISIGKLRAEASQYPDVSRPIQDWYNFIRKSEPTCLEDVRLVYRETEAVGNLTVFNIKGNNYRLIVDIDYEESVVYYKYFLTHAEYDKNRWKNDPYY